MRKLKIQGAFSFSSLSYCLSLYGGENEYIAPVFITFLLCLSSGGAENIVCFEPYFRLDYIYMVRYKYVILNLLIAHRHVAYYFANAKIRFLLSKRNIYLF